MAPKRLAICGLEVCFPPATEKTYIAHPINPRKVAPRVFPMVAVTAILTEAQQAGEGGRKKPALWQTLGHYTKPSL